MSTYVLKKVKAYYDEYSLANFVRGMSFEVNIPPIDSTQHGGNDRTHVPGLKDSCTLSHTGFHDNTTTYTPDDLIEPLRGTADIITTICPTDGTDGEIAYCSKQVLNYTPIDGALGDLGAFTINGKGSGTLVRGTVMKDCYSTAVTTDGNGTAYQLGTCDTGETLYMIWHVYEFDGGTLACSIYSDDAEAFTTGQLRGGFTNATATTKQWTYASGDDAWGDDWWRAQWTYNGTACKFIVVVGIK